MTDIVLEIDNLSVDYATTRGPVRSLSGVSLTAKECDVIGVVGESGSGKSTLAAAIGGLLPHNATFPTGSVVVDGCSILDSSREDVREIRMETLGFIQQNPISALDPTRTVRRSMADVLANDADAASALKAVGLLNVEQVLRSYPHQLSGGMAQRVAIAMALARDPRVLVADEPTSALDPGVSETILELLIALSRDRDCALLIITHDLSIVGRWCDRVVVMKEGAIVEQGDTATVLAHPEHDYTQALLTATETLHSERSSAHPAQETGRSDAPIVSIENASVVYHSGPPWARVRKHAVEDVSLEIAVGEMVGLVGPSGSGKTTMSNLLLGLVRPDTGRVLIDGRPLLSPRQGEPGKVQVVLQHPEWALNPFLTIGSSVAEPLLISGARRGRALRANVDEYLDWVGLDPILAARYPHELSGGQRQRAAVARALISEPRLVVFDEAVSALDVSVQAQILKLIRRTQSEVGYAGLFISHDASAVAYVADRIVTMSDGHISVADENESA